MDKVKTLTPPPALYDYVLYYECASKDWNKGAKKTSIKGDGSLMDLINWNSTYSYDPDDTGGNTLFGVTESTWKSFVEKYPNKGYSSTLNGMGKGGWLDVISYFWNDYSCSESANYACAFALFQLAWGGFNINNLKKLLETLQKNADKKNYNFITDGGYYKKIADSTHAYTDPMVAYDFIRKAKSTYLYNISTPDKTNKKYRCGWLTRSVLSFTPYGLYIPIDISYTNGNLDYSSTLEQWENVAIKWIQENKSGYVKIMDWGQTPEKLTKITSRRIYDYVYSTKSQDSNSSNISSSGVYGGCGGVYQLGDYSNSIDGIKEQKQIKHREDILNILIGGSYTPNNIKKCSELISADKKKGIKIKSES